MTDNPMTSDEENGVVEEQQPIARRFEVNFDTAFAADVAPRYATNILVQRTEHEYIISFYEVTPPILIGSINKVQKKLDEMQEAPTRCVARVIVAASRMPEFVATFQKSLQNAPMVISE